MLVESISLSNVKQGKWFAVRFLDGTSSAAALARAHDAVPSRAGAVGEVKRLLRSAFTSHCVIAAGRAEGFVGTAESSLCAASAAIAALT